MEINEATIKEIIVVTDGQSNIGGNPVEAARKAFRKGITVSTIGIIDQKEQREAPFQEVVNMAEAGGGHYEYTYIDNLSQTIHTLSHKTVTSTLQEAVNKQLKQLMGNELNQMPPESRSKLLNYIDKYSDEVGVCCCILLDCSGSMAHKIQSARHSILDLLDSFGNRKGRIDIAVVAFPGEQADTCRVLHHFNDDLNQMERNLHRMKPKGGTPTAVAIDYATKLIEDFYSVGRNKERITALEEYVV
ncbi:vWA domain-containing protein [Alkaliphilus hydrothermalis]|uniref:Ca-activated chloride channel family protein n=1 Tax=Alkaliphilus hydrothermalis TaxID=1482730 RepID=A0ABS2NSN4_9FIRM|nr:VWA domain-containing protein [Alkaliphilus hydrothermalis]MBM7615967.1 Ca-activated chloride channel family protein [Alkaliphilus hydrothermalis]